MSSKKDIVRELRNSIIKGEYKPGKRLTEISLSRRFNVSRTPIREALSWLQKEGFIEIIPAIGARVVKLSLKNVSDVYDILITLEGLASRLAANNLTNEQIDKLEEYHLMMMNALSKKNFDLTSELNIRFHRLIREATNNSYLVDLRINLRYLVDWFNSVFVFIHTQWEETLKEHRLIIDAFKTRNPALAEFVTREHFEGAKKRFLEYFGKDQQKDQQEE